MRPFRAQEACELIWPHAQFLFAGRFEELARERVDPAHAPAADAALLELAANPHLGVGHLPLPVQRLIQERYNQAMTIWLADPHRVLSQVAKDIDGTMLLSLVIHRLLVGMELPIPTRQ